MGVILEVVVFAALVIAFARFAPLIMLALWMLIVHAPGKMFMDQPWNDWEWGIVVVALVLEGARHARKAKARAKPTK